jgi:hypothetical protein
VDIIIATDGVVMFDVGYHGWVLATKDETILLRGGASDDRVQSLMSSYRLELGGIVAGLAVTGTLYHAGTKNIQYVWFICNNESAVTATKWPTSDSIFHNTKGDWELIVTIQDLILRWCDGIAFIFHWVKGHTDLIVGPLTRDERLKIKAN